jgi:hypothetical protein
MPAFDSAETTRRDIFRVVPAVFLINACGAPAVGDRAEVRDDDQGLEPVGDQIRGFKTSGFTPRAVAPARRPYGVGAPRKDKGAHNAAGVRMKKLNGRHWDHPVVQAAYGLQNLWTWETTHDVFFLDRARAQAERLVARRTEARGAWFLPYPFKFSSPRHRLLMRPPWYSAMAQGEALSLFSRLAGTAELPEPVRDGYRRAAEGVFAALNLGPQHRPWVTHLDARHYLCLEEYPQYPHHRSDFTFNGHNYAAVGLWDYHALTGSRRAAQLFDGALTTSVHYARALRRRSDYSSYCLRHDVRNGKYHQVVTRQLRILHVISGHPVFARIANEYARDAAKRARRSPRARRSSVRRRPS